MVTTAQKACNADIVNQLRSWIFVLFREKGKDTTPKKSKSRNNKLKSVENLGEIFVKVHLAFLCYWTRFP